MINIDLDSQLQAFRNKITLQSVTLGDHDWSYYAVGDTDAEALLLLSGGGGDAEAMFHYIQAFSEHFYVIAPNYPNSAKTLSYLVAGSRALLSHEGFDRCVVVGISFGGMLAQLLIRRFQTIVTDLIITHTTIPSQHLAEVLRMQHQMVRTYPEPLLLWMSKRSIKGNLAQTITSVADEDIQFWQSYFEHTYGTRIKKKDLVMRARLTAEYHSDNEFNSRDLLNWHGDLLIIESERDDVISDGDRGSLKAMYSRAYIQTLEESDHFAPLLQADRISRSMLKFLHREGSE